MRVVITGASGNVGTALLRVLPAEHQVVGMVRRPPAQQGVYQRADWCSLDLSEDHAIAELRRVFEGPDVVVHLAWGFQPTRDTRYLRRLGVGGTSAVLQAAHASGVVNWFICPRWEPMPPEVMASGWMNRGRRAKRLMRYQCDSGSSPTGPPPAGRSGCSELSAS